MKLNIVPASTGLTWVKLGITTFFKQPLALGGLFFMSIALSQILAIVPIIGAVIAMVIMPAMTLGMTVATLQAVQGKFPMPAVLVSAFKLNSQRTKAMLVLGVMYALALMVVMGLVALAGGAEIAKEINKGGVPNPEIFQHPDFLSSLLVGIVSYMAISLAFWHAPALVYWYGVSPSKAVFFSVVACMRNFSAYALYGAGWFATFMLGLTLAAVASRLLNLGNASGLMMLPLALILTSMFVSSIYFTFRDSFVHDDTMASTQPADPI